MKTIITILSLLILLGAGCQKPMGAGTLTESEILSAIETAQSNYIKTHSKYFQGLKTSSISLTTKPYYQTEKWSDFISFQKSLPFEVEIHQYITDKGEIGYIVKMYKTIDGTPYMKSVGYGAKAQEFTFDWQDATPVKPL